MLSENNHKLLHERLQDNWLFLFQLFAYKKAEHTSTKWQSHWKSSELGSLSLPMQPIKIRAPIPEFYLLFHWYWKDYFKSVIQKASNHITSISTQKYAFFLQNEHKHIVKFGEGHSSLDCSYAITNRIFRLKEETFENIK